MCSSNRSTVPLSVFALLLCCCGLPRAQPTARRILRKVEQAEVAPHSISTVKQTITTSSGNTRTFRIKGYAIGGGEKQLQVYEEPARVRVEKILMLDDGDDIWSFSPKTKRVRHLATHMKKAKVMGSDFSYQDFAMGDYTERFTPALLKTEEVDGVDCYKLELIPTDEGPMYAREILWVATSDYVSRRVDFYDDEGLLKRLTVDEVKVVNGRPTAWRMTMEALRDGGSTVVEMIDVDYGTEPSERLFTQQGLRRL
jgi:outer membrane lipoprotein-sorting protein